MEGDEMEYESSQWRIGQQWDLNRMIGIMKVQNLVFLAFAYCTQTVYTEHDCVDPEKTVFVNRSYIGNLIVFIVIVIGIFITKVPPLYECLNRCGAVVVTIQTCLFQALLIIFHFFFMVYSIQQHFFSDPTQCKEIELFLMVYAYVSIVWIFLQIYSALLRVVCKAFQHKTEVALDNQNNSQDVPLQNMRN